MQIAKDSSSDSRILSSIETKRKELILLGSKTGLKSSETLKCSKELDKLIYIYQFKRIKD